MSAGSSNNTSKMKRGEDRISILPDDILHQIFSSVDMKEIVQMSILSKRWRYFWLSVPNLNFDHKLWSRVKRCKFDNEMSRECYVKIDFVNFIDTVLCLHENFDIAKVFFSCNSYYSIIHLHKFMADLARLHVREVHIKIWPQSSQAFPNCLFTSELERFTFEASRGRGCYDQLPNTMGLASRLRALKLEAAILPNGNLRGELVLRCPVLEELIILDCDHRHVKILDISLPKLVNLVIENCYVFTNNGFCEIKICTPRLEALRCKGYLYRRYSVKNFPSLVNASMDIGALQIGNTQSLTEILEVLKNTKLTLTLRSEWFQLHHFADMLEFLPTILQNIKHLKLINWYIGSSICAIANLLKVSPNIETIYLEIDEVELMSPENDADWSNTLEFECIFHELKRVEIHNINRCENHLKLLEYFLKNAIVLENITINMEKTFLWGQEELTKFIDDIQSLPKASSSAAIEVICHNEI